MTRFLATLRRDVRLQVRYRVVAVSVFVIAFWVLLLALVPNDVRPEPELLVPAFVMVNLVTTTFYFVCGMVLVERGEGMLVAVVTTPLRQGEYLMSKAISLSALAAAETLAVVFWFFGTGGWLPLVTGAGLLGVLYVLLGFVAVARYDSINRFLLPSIVLVTLLVAPLVPHFGGADRWLLVWHPVEPPMALLRSAYGSVSVAELGYGLLGSLVWIALAYRWARRAFDTHVVASA
jgi:fluoroquinolone transport system permease protein